MPDDTKPKPWVDPIVSQVREAREALFASVGYDIERLSQRLRKEQLESGREVVTRSPRRPNHRTGEAA